MAYSAVMANVAWLGIPVIAVLFATAWAHWSARPRGPEDPTQSVAAYERFRAAMSSGPGSGPRTPAA